MDRELLIEIGEPECVRTDLVQILQPQPLRGESRSERLGARIGEHAPHLPVAAFVDRQLKFITKVQ